MANNTSQHILNTSASLLGFCLFVITSLKISNKIETSYIDELTSVVAILLSVSSFLSFISIRTTNQRREKLFETVADYFFVSALIGILVIILLITFNFIN
jgi:surface polysaccharide O-acyltransferase-like enzyme